MTEDKIALEWVKANLNKILDQFSDISASPATGNPITLFTAGATGAGKTEFSITLARILAGREIPTYLVRIDADHIRELFKQFGYDGTNAAAFSRSTSRIVDQLTYRTLKTGQDVIIDGTMANLDAATRNIELALKNDRAVGIYYIYQKPELAWHFAQVRKKADGREVTKNVFIKSYLDSAKNLNVLKARFGQEIKVHIVEKAAYNTIKRVYLNVDKVDGYVNITMTKEELESLL